MVLTYLNNQRYEKNTLFLSLLVGLTFGMISLTSCSSDDDNDSKKKVMNFQEASDVIDLSKLTDGYVYTIKDGSVLTGTVENKGIGLFLADGATVTLDNATIKGTDVDAYDWGGLQCLGNATIILKDGTTNYVRGFWSEYPGIYVPENHTVVIKGDGTLTACSNGNGAGIGGGGFRNEAGSSSTACKKIIIQNTVTSVSATKVPGCVNSVGRSTKETKCGQIVIGGTMYWDSENYVNSGENYLTKSTMVYEPEK